MADTTHPKHVTNSHAPDHHEKHSSVTYYVIWIALLILTGVTVWTGQMHMPTFGLYLAMIIATTKATLVVLFFMHLWEQKGVNRVTFVSTIAFVIIMLLGVMGDYTTRLVTMLPAREAPASELPKGAQGGSTGGQDAAKPVGGAAHP